MKVNNVTDWREILNRKVIPVRATNVTSRVISYWLDTGLINDDRSGSKYRYFTYLEFFWVCIIVEFRKYKYPNDSIMKIKKMLESPLQSDYIAGELSTLEEAVLKMIIDGENLFLEADSTGVSHVINEETYLYNSRAGFHIAYMHIRLTRLFKLKIKNIGFNTYFKKYMRLTEGEHRVLEGYYEKDTTKIIIHTKEEPMLLEVLPDSKNRMIDQKLLDTLKYQNYERIDIIKNNDDLISIQKTEKPKVKGRKKKD